MPRDRIRTALVVYVPVAAAAVGPCFGLLDFWITDDSDFPGGEVIACCGVVSSLSAAAAGLFAVGTAAKVVKVALGLLAGWGVFFLPSLAFFGLAMVAWFIVDAIA